MCYPKTKEEWWSFVDANWERLESIVMNYYPNLSTFPADGWPLPYPNLEPVQRACNTVIKQFRQEKPVWETLGSFNEYLLGLKRTKDPKLAEIFEMSWFGVPESVSLINIPGFFMFCVLCSEACLLNSKED